MDMDIKDLEDLAIEKPQDAPGSPAPPKEADQSSSHHDSQEPVPSTIMGTNATPTQPSVIESQLDRNQLAQAQSDAKVN